MRTAIYIDGFSLYYAELKGTRYRWLDLREVCRRAIKSRHEIVLVRYFTAQITPRAGTPNDHGPEHQKLYLKALKAHTAQIEIHLGHFLSGTARCSLANSNPPRTVEVIKTEEKAPTLTSRFTCSTMLGRVATIALWW